ncbi:lipopolysaccharide biosynthesis protein [Intestinibacter bartlettii]|uniref:lipopolysaccharide biosynthesis protein n=1 Tax=Intestinibacter bartlettii TaxID=261299 RepID=UPI0026762808|nr:oligosaccharide flippase family protein [Intestinibacter bartlettii]
MRVENSIKNIISSLCSNIVTSLLGFISRTIFIYTLGKSYLGISALLQNVFGLLAISELGISTAIGFSLYKPLAENNNKLISTLMTIYKKAYRIIAITILFLGIILYNYLDFFVNPNQQPKEIFYIYFLYLINIVIGYFLSYKTTLISSDQKAYKLVPIQIKLNIVTILIQILYLLIFKDYLGYLTIQILSSILINVIQNRFITKEYNYLNFSSKDKLPTEEKRIIIKNMFGLMAAKLGDFCVNSTDNLIISKFVDLASVAIYSNYIMIRNLVNGYIGILFGAITSSFGNLVAEGNEKKSLELFNTLFFLSFMLYSFEAVSFLCLFNPFIGDLWIGKEYLFSMNIVLAIVINNYLTGLRMPIITMKSAAGIYAEDAWVPFGFAIMNLGASIVLGKYWGVFGVIVGSIIGSICTADWFRPIVVFKKVFKVSYWNYFKNYFKYIILGFAYMFISVEICNIISISNIFINFILRCFVCVFVPNTITILLFFKTPEFKYLYNVFSNMFLSKIVSKFRRKENV